MKKIVIKMRTKQLIKLTDLLNPLFFYFTLYFIIIRKTKNNFKCYFSYLISL